MTTPTIERQCHWLRRNRRSKRPNLLIFADTEATLTPIHELADHHTLKLGWACLTRYVPHNGLKTIGWTKITDPLDFWWTISNLAIENKCTYLITHNLDYDARILRAFSILPGIGWEPAYAILGTSCKFFTFKADKSTIALLDNMNYWNTSLATIGKELGIEKLEIDLETATDSELSTYCKRDVEILRAAWDYWLRFLDEHDAGDFAITIAGQSMNTFRHRFMHHKIGIHNRLDAINLERASYRGGRCEVFRVGKFTWGPYHKLDINGLYAHCMRQYPVPTKLVKVLVDVKPQYLDKLLSQYQAVADVLVETDEPYYAVRSRGFNVFPTGSFRVTLTTHELAHALQNDHLRAIGPVAIYESATVFDQFIDYFTPLRQKYKAAGDTARSQLCKMIRNSLYGKFGQRGYKQEVIGKAPLDKVSVRRWIDLETGKECSDWTYGGIVLRQEAGGEGQDSFPAIASHIAAAGRCVLWDYVLKAGKRNCYYADTDSIIVNQQGYDNLAEWIDPLKLGYLKVEGVTHRMEFHAKKDYVFGNERVSKGIRKNASRNADGSWHQTHFTSLKWAFSRGDLDDVITYEVDKHNTSLLTHGKILADGSIKPPEFRLDVDQVSAWIAPIDATRWDWWIDVPWLQSLQSRKQSLPLPEWYVRALLNPAGV